jgi:hypothetical protein
LRTVVDDDQFEIAEGLSQDAVDAARQQRGTVISREDNAYLKPPLASCLVKSCRSLAL